MFDQLKLQKHTKINVLCVYTILLGLLIPLLIEQWELRVQDEKRALVPLSVLILSWGQGNDMQEGRQVWFQRFVFELGLQDRADQCWKAKWVNRWVANCGPRARRTGDRETAQQVQGTTRCCSATMGIQFTSAGSSWSFNAAPWLTEDKKTFEFGKRQEPDSAQREEPNSTWTQRKRSFNQDPHPGPWHTCNLMA